MAEPVGRSARRARVAPFPLRDRALVEAGALRQLLLAETGGTPGSPERFGERSGGRLRLVLKELEDDRQVPSLRLGLVPLPVPDGILRHTDATGDVPLEQPSVEPALAKVVAQSPQLRRIRGILWLFGPQGQMAKGQ